MTRSGSCDFKRAVPFASRSEMSWPDASEISRYGMSRKKTVPAHLFAANHAFEQASVATFVNSIKRRYWCQRIGDHSTEDRNPRVFLCEPFERRKIRKLAHLWLLSESCMLTGTTTICADWQSVAAVSLESARINLDSSRSLARILLALVSVYFFLSCTTPRTSKSDSHRPG